MSTFATYSLLGLVAIFGALGAFLIAAVALRYFGFGDFVESDRQRLDRLEIAFEGFAAQYALSNTQHAAQLGKLRRALARERGEEEEEEAEAAPAPVERLGGKQELRRRAGLGG